MRGLDRRSCVMLIPVLVAPGCSLMGLDDFGVTPCRSSAECVKAEAQLKPAPTACGAAVCEPQTGLCQWREAKEICNGQDDDCDGLIDEGLDLPAQMASTDASEPMPVGFASASVLASTASPPQTFVAIVPGEGASEGLSLAPSSFVTELQYDSAVTPNDCPQDPPSTDPPSCNFAEVALAADASHLVVASINTWGCASGQLRVGLGEIGGAPFKVFLGKAFGVQSEENSNLALGVDIEGKCTRARQSPGAAQALAPGCTHPAVASLGTDAKGEGALLVWLAASARHGAPVTSTSVPVEALGLTVPDVKPVWLNGTDGGTPRVLGDSTSVSTPAVLALQPEGGAGSYLVAFPAQSDDRSSIELLQLSVNHASRSLVIESRQFLGLGVADQVSLAAGDPERAEVGMAWRSGSGEQAQVQFTVLAGAVNAPLAGSIVSIPASDFPSVPRLLHQRTGFATEEPRGGWFLSWVDFVNDRQIFRLARVRDGSLETLNQSSLPVGGVSLLYPSEDDSSDDDSAVGFASIPAAVGGKSEPETIPRWCQ